MMELSIGKGEAKESMLQCSVENPRDFTEQEDADERLYWNKSQDKELKTVTE
jgi:hypothetical protein